jgi:hypothetical protein
LRQPIFRRTIRDGFLTFRPQDDDRSPSAVDDGAACPPAVICFSTSWRLPGGVMFCADAHHLHAPLPRGGVERGA